MKRTRSLGHHANPLVALQGDLLTLVIERVGTLSAMLMASTCKELHQRIRVDCSHPGHRIARTPFAICFQIRSFIGQLCSSIEPFTLLAPPRSWLRGFLLENTHVLIESLRAKVPRGPERTFRKNVAMWLVETLPFASEEYREIFRRGIVKTSGDFKLGKKWFDQLLIHWGDNVDFSKCRKWSRESGRLDISIKLMGLEFSSSSL